MLVACSLLCSELQTLLLHLPHANELGKATIWPLIVQAAQQHDHEFLGVLCQHPAALQGSLQDVADLAEQALLHKHGEGGAYAGLLHVISAAADSRIRAACRATYLFVCVWCNCMAQTSASMCECCCGAGCAEQQKPHHHAHHRQCCLYGLHQHCGAAQAHCNFRVYQSSKGQKCFVLLSLSVYITAVVSSFNCCNRCCCFLAVGCSCRAAGGAAAGAGTVQ